MPRQTAFLMRLRRRPCARAAPIRTETSTSFNPRTSCSTVAAMAVDSTRAALAAAAAALQVELTLPGVAQTVVLTRTSGRASAMPDGEKLAAFAATGATLAIHLSVHVLERLIAELTPHYGADCPVAVVWRASWPDQRIVRATLATLNRAVGAEMERTALILVGRALDAEAFDESRLYAGDYDRRFRPTGANPRFPEGT